jgi:hypothetical protein
LNESNAFTTNDSDSNSFNNNIDFNKSFRKKGRNISLNFENDNSKTESSSINNSRTIFYQGTEPDDNRNQIKNYKNISDNYALGIEYTEPITDSLNISVNLALDRLKLSEDRTAFDYNATTDSYSIENASLTNYLTSTKNRVSPKVGISSRKSKYNFSLYLGTDITQFDNSSLYLGTMTNLNKEYVLPSINFYGGYNFTKSKSIWSNYGYNVDFPSANQILPVENLANPLNTFIGNANLNPNKYHQGYFSFRDYDYATRSGYSIYMGGSYYDSQIVSSTTFDANRKRTTTYENLSGTYETWLGGNWNKSIKNGAHNFKFGFGLNAGYDLSKGFTDGQIYDAKVLDLTPRVNFTYEYGELFTINPTYRYTVNQTNFTNYTVNSASNFVHKFNVQTTNFWPKNWVFGNDFGYTYNSNIADGFKKDFYLLNTSLSYSFYKKKLMAKVKVYDLLNQNQNATRTITPTTIRDEENIVLKRYAMFSLTYKLEKFGAKEKPARNRFMM